MANIEIEVEKIRQAIYGEEVRGSICDALLAMNTESSNAMSYAQTAQDSAAAKASEASTSAATAQSAAETAAEDAAENAVVSVESRLSGYVLQASTSAAAAARASDLVASSLIIVQNAEARSLQASSLSRQWAEGPNGDPSAQPSATNNAKHWADEAARIAQTITGGITPMGSVTFANLPQNPETGWMYKITDNFTTDSRFDEGAGISYNAGTSVYYTAQNKWTISAAAIGTIPLSYIDSLFS